MNRFGARLLMLCTLLIGLLQPVPVAAEVQVERVFTYLEEPGHAEVLHVIPAVLVNSKAFVSAESFVATLGGVVEHHPQRKAVCLTVVLPVTGSPQPGAHRCDLPEGVQVTKEFVGHDAVPLVLNGKALPGESPALQGVADRGDVERYIPVRAVAEALGLTVLWNPVERSVAVTAPNRPSVGCLYDKVGQRFDCGFDREILLWQNGRVIANAPLKKDPALEATPAPEPTPGPDSSPASESTPAPDYHVVVGTPPPPLAPPYLDSAPQEWVNWMLRWMGLLPP